MATPTAYVAAEGANNYRSPETRIEHGRFYAAWVAGKEDNAMQTQTADAGGAEEAPMNWLTLSDVVFLLVTSALIVALCLL